MEIDLEVTHKRRRNLSGIDLMNKKFYKLLVVSVAEKNKKRAYWNCLCDCGKNKIISAYNLVNGRVRHCGCSLEGETYLNSKYFKEISGSYLYQIRNGAKTRGLVYDVSSEYLWDLFESQNRCCKLSGQSLIFTHSKVRSLTTASLDRIDSSKGYIAGNVQWVHKDINLTKHNFSDEYFIETCKKIAKIANG